jgi:hypothetical protein
MEKRIIRIVSDRPKYRRYTFPVIAKWDENSANYITGQHKSDENPQGLTKEEMQMAPEALPKAKRDKYEYIVRPDTAYHIKHMRAFNVSVDDSGKPVNPVDYWQLELFKLQEFVAPAKGKVNKDKHIYYLEDKLAEDTTEINKRKQTWKATSKVMENASVESYADIATLLTYLIPNFSINVNASTSVTIEKAILAACETHPDQVMKCFEKPSQDILFVLKLQRYAIITRRESSYFDGNTFLGDSPQDVLRFAKTKEGATYYAKWTRHLAKYENRDIGKEEVNEDSN